MRLVSLGDLILDVIVGLDGPARSRATTGGDDPRRGRAGRPRTSPPGPRRSAPRRATSGKRGADAAGELAARELASHGVEIAGPRGQKRRRRLDRRGRRALDGLRPRLGDRARAGRARPGLVPLRRASTSRATRCSRARGRAAAERAVELARAAGAAVSVDLSVLEPDRRALPRAGARCAPDVVFATEREREAFGPLDAALGGQARSASALGWTAWTIPPFPRTSSTRPAPATRSPPASSSVASSSGSQAAARCCAKLGAMP